MSRRYAVDTSNWTGMIPPESAQCMREKGFDKAIINLFDGNIARQQYDAYKAAEFEVDGYIYFEFDKDGVAQLREQLANLQGRVIGRLWIDCEDFDASYMTEAATVQYIWTIVKACEGVVNTGIYTRKSWWEYQTANDTSFSRAGLLLWDATNDASDDMSYVPYGGWQKSYMEQYRFDVELCGETVDLNVYEDADTETPPDLRLAYTGFSDNKYNYNLTVEIGGGK